jgi:hypothetical protein
VWLTTITLAVSCKGSSLDSTGSCCAACFSASCKSTARHWRLLSIDRQRVQIIELGHRKSAQGQFDVGANSQATDCTEALAGYLINSQWW